MKVVASLKTIKNRDKNCRVIRRKGRRLCDQQAQPAFQGVPGLNRRP